MSLQSIRHLLYFTSLIAAFLISGCDFGYGDDNDNCGRITGRDLVLSRISLDSLETSNMESFVRIPFEEDVHRGAFKIIGISEDAATFYFVQGLNYNRPSSVFSLTAGEDSLQFLFVLPDITSIHYSPKHNQFIYWKETLAGTTIQRINADGTNILPIGNFKASVEELLSDEEHLILRGDALEDSTGIWQLNVFSLSLKQLVNDLPYRYNYAITPDGSHIAYGRSYNDRGDFEPIIYVRSTSDTTLTMYQGSGVGELNFSHDGKWLTYINSSERANPQPHRVWFINLETSEQFPVGEPLRESFSGFNFPSFTLDDSYVLFGFNHESFYLPIDANASQELFFDRLDFFELRSGGNYVGSVYDVHTSTVQHNHNGSWLYRADDVSTATSCH